jgi:hypothetical protein
VGTYNAYHQRRGQDVNSGGDEVVANFVQEGRNGEQTRAHSGVWGRTPMGPVAKPRYSGRRSEGRKHLEFKKQAKFATFYAK